jgi:hypothetical protein
MTVLGSALLFTKVRNTPLTAVEPRLLVTIGLRRVSEGLKKTRPA